MRRDVLEIDASWQDRVWEHRLGLQDVEAVRLVLSGGSVVDWQRLAFDDPATERADPHERFADVDRFLRLHCLDMALPEHRARLRYVFNEAVSYLEEHLKLHFPRELRSPDDVREVFLWASQYGGFRRTQILSCVILKLMHVIQHLAAADLRHRIPISEADVLALAHRRILASARAMQDDGVPVLSFTGNQKSRSSVITKLLAKKEDVAATLFDKLRYRCVVREHEHLAQAMTWMVRSMFPFNYVIPGQSHNNLLDPEDLVAMLSPPEVERAQDVRDTLEGAENRNRFSGASYRVINFIVDYPVPLPPSRHRFDLEMGHTVFVNVEIQVLDAETARNNERGDSAHHLYKQRQQQVVAQRLKRGGRRS